MRVFIASVCRLLAGVCLPLLLLLVAAAANAVVNACCSLLAIVAAARTCAKRRAARASSSTLLPLSPLQIDIMSVLSYLLVYRGVLLLLAASGALVSTSSRKQHI